MRKALIAVTALLLLIPVAATAQNSPPVADAGEEQTIFLGESATLHGTATDPDGHAIVGWHWEVVSSPAGSNHNLAASSTPNAVFTADTLGGYGITLIAWDGLAWSEPDATVVWVIENHPPTAVALASPLSGPAPLEVTFDGTGSSDPEGGDLLYDWDFDDGFYGTGATTTHVFDFPGIYTVYLVVTDDHGLDHFDGIDITVDEPTPAWGEASVVGMHSASPSKGLNYLIALLIPIGAVLLWKGLRRR